MSRTVIKESCRQLTKVNSYSSFLSSSPLSPCVSNFTNKFVSVKCELTNQNQQCRNNRLLGRDRSAACVDDGGEWGGGWWRWGGDRWSIFPAVSLYREQWEQAVKAGGFERPFQPNLPIAIQEVIIIFVSEGGWGSVMQENNTEKRIIRRMKRTFHGHRIKRNTKKRHPSWLLGPGYVC